MSFLLLQIFFLMVLAAVLGALLAWWWFRRNYEDVTVVHEEMVTKSKAGAAVVPATKEEVTAGLADLRTAISGVRVPDIQPLQDRLSRIETAVAATGNLMPALGQLNDRFSKVETLVQQPDEELERIAGRLADLEGALTSISGEINRFQPADLDPVETRLAQLEEAVKSQPPAPDVDLGPVHAGFARLELAMQDIDLPETDIEPLRTHLAAMEARLAEFAERLDTQRKTDLENLTIRMSTLSSSLAGLRIPDFDPVKERLSRIETSLENLPAPELDIEPLLDRMRLMENYLRAPSDDVRMLQNRLADIESGSASIHSKLTGVENAISVMARTGVDLTPVQGRIAALESAISAVRMEVQSMPDLTPMVSTVRKMEARLDMGAVENRLTAIEYSLASIHHMLRSREGASLMRQEDYGYRAPPAAWSRPAYEPPQPYYTAPKEPEPIPAPEPAPAPIQPEPEPQPAVHRAPDPVPPADPVEAMLRPGDEANLLTEAAFGQPDDLEEVSGIGPMLCELLNEIGVYYFWQIAEWTPKEVAWVDEKLEHFKGRIERDEWVDQAKELAQRPGAARRPGSD
ncbi:MAG: hypothetical protein KDA53_12455 [Hyphomonas sp.]|nr:hypothetical protein [Hyphomonas sp.]